MPAPDPVEIGTEHPKVMADPTSGCWIWIGDRHKGYGRRHDPRTRRYVFVHRLAYEQRYGAIPPELVIDHVCRMPACVNPQHLDVVTSGENLRRGMAPGMVRRRSGRCAQGHDLAVAYVRRDNGGRVCKPCRAAAARRFRARVKAMTA